MSSVSISSLNKTAYQENFYDRQNASDESSLRRSNSISEEDFFIQAVNNGRDEEVEKFLSAKRMPREVLIQALKIAHQNNFGCIFKLVKKQLGIQIRLHASAFKGNLDAAQYIINNRNISQAEKNIAYWIAKKKNIKPMADILISAGATDPTLSDAISSGNVKCFRELLPVSSHESINKALYNSIIFGKSFGVKLLLRAGANPCFFPDAFLWPPMIRAPHQGNWKITKILCEWGIDVSKSFTYLHLTPIECAITAGNNTTVVSETKKRKTIEVLVSFGSENWERMANKWGFTKESIIQINTAALKMINQRKLFFYQNLIDYTPIYPDVSRIIVEYLNPPNYEYLKALFRSSKADLDTHFNLLLAKSAG